MADVTVTVGDNGPYIVSGVKVVDQDGNEFEARDTYALCRCGQSSSKPFCDGTHRAAEFSSEPRAK